MGHPLDVPDTAIPAACDSLLDLADQLGLVIQACPAQVAPSPAKVLAVLHHRRTYSSSSSGTIH